MWSNLPLDLLSNIFSLLCPQSLARAISACRNWHACANSYSLAPSRHYSPWFVVTPARNNGHCCYIHNTGTDTWYELPLNFLPDPVRPLAAIGSLILMKSSHSTILQLGLCNPFTREFRHLPKLNIPRTNPASGVFLMGPSPTGPFQNFQVYVVGGMSDLPSGLGGATYEATLEIYDSRNDTWRIYGKVPLEFAIRLTVWTPADCVCLAGVLYWMTSAKVYSIMGFEIGLNTWRELSVPLADRLDFASLVRRNGKLALVGGINGNDACVWELNDGDVWVVIDKVPIGLGVRFLGDKKNWGSTRCSGSDDEIWLYKDLRSEMIVWRQVKDKLKWEWEWDCVDGCCFIRRGRQTRNMQIKGLFLYPQVVVTSCISIS